MTWKAKGVGVIEKKEEIPAHAGGTIVIRSHGVPRDLYEELAHSGARIVDTTCTFVKRIHEIVWKASEEGRHIVIIGNHGHAETLGTMGWSSLSCHGDRDKRGGRTVFRRSVDPDYRCCPDHISQ